METTTLCAGDGDYTKWDTRLASQKPLRVRRSRYVERQNRKRMFTPKRHGYKHHTVSLQETP